MHTFAYCLPHLRMVSINYCAARERLDAVAQSCKNASDRGDGVGNHTCVQNPTTLPKLDLNPPPPPSCYSNTYLWITFQMNKVKNWKVFQRTAKNENFIFDSNL